MIKAWRSEWHGLHPSMPPEAPFLFVQVSGAFNLRVGFFPPVLCGECANKIKSLNLPSQALDSKGRRQFC
jgi:hypothetical protein